MRFQCPYCLGIVGIDDSEAGQAVACGHCARAVVVPPTRVSAGSVINDFVVQKELGKGGVGTVYLAQQLSLARPVALKILNPRFSADQAYVADFIREARAAAQLNHPNIVQAYAVGEEEGLFFFAMEFVEGTTLKQVLAHSGRIVWERALMIMAEVNAALDFAWTNQRLVHRDIKPDNIILTDDGRIKLADLGLARRASDLLNEKADEVMGTPQYISPEALLQQPLDNRSDIYSLGATLFHTVTGRFPFLGDTPMEIARKHLTERLPHPKTVVLELPEAVSVLIEVMMAKRPEQRYADSAELARDMDLVRHRKMPRHPLAADAQQPIEPGEAEAVAAPAAPVSASGRMPGRTTGGPKRLILKGGARPAAGAAQTAAETPPDAAAVTETPVETGGEPPAEAAPVTTAMPRRRRGLSVAALAWILGLVGLVALVVVGGLVAVAIRERGKSQEQKRIEELCEGQPKDQVAAFMEVLRGLRSGAPPAEALGLIKGFRAKYPGTSPLTEELARRAAPLVEQELEQLRLVRANEERAAWVVQSRALQEQARLERERQEEEARAAAEAARKAEEEERRRLQREQLLAGLREQQNEVRSQALDLGRQSRFQAARLLFTPLAQSREEEFRTWATSMQRVYERAEKLSASVGGLKQTLQGEKYSIPGRLGKWAVTNVGLRDISFETRTIDPKTGEYVSRSETFVIPDLPPTFVVALVEKPMQKGGLSAEEVNLAAGAYLFARADPAAFAEARRRLAAAGEAPEAAIILAELEVAEPLIKKRLFADALIQLRFLLNKGDRPKAVQLANELRQRFPDLYQADEATITGLLQGN